MKIACSVKRTVYRPKRYTLNAVRCVLNFELWFLVFGF